MQQLLKTNKILIKILLLDLSNKYNGVDVIFLFKDNWSVITNRLFFSSKNVL